MFPAQAVAAHFLGPGKKRRTLASQQARVDPVVRGDDLELAGELALTGGVEDSSRSLDLELLSDLQQQGADSDRGTRGCCGCVGAERSRAVLRVIDSAQVQCCLLLLILVDISVTIAQIVFDVQEEMAVSPDWIFGVTLGIIAALTLEVALRWLALGTLAFFSHWSNVLDLAVTLISLVLEVLIFILHRTAEDTAGSIAFIRAVRPIARCARVFRVLAKAQQPCRGLVNEA